MARYDECNTYLISKALGNGTC